ncbi:MAG: hypothetical protein CMJ62_13630 [Planctomycetaceae bacterium]|jgi:hypothetical protein|nr:hypothetical protein [Planctomycetaceae bacterium]
MKRFAGKDPFPNIPDNFVIDGDFNPRHPGTQAVMTGASGTTVIQTDTLNKQATFSAFWA